MILAGRAWPVQGYLTYGATVLWAFAGIVVNQYAASTTTGAALLAAALVAITLVGALRGGGPRGSGRRTAHPGTA